MNGITHMAVGAAIGVLYVTTPHDQWTNTRVYPPDTVIASLGLIVTAIVGALAPDIDHARSLISQRVGVLGWFVRMITSHRGLTHTIWFGGAIVLGLSMIHIQLAGLFSMGFISHLVLDMLTPAGLRLAYPVFDTSFVLAPRRLLGLIKPVLEFCLLGWSLILIGGKLWGI